MSEKLLLSVLFFSSELSHGAPAVVACSRAEVGERSLKAARQGAATGRAGKQSPPWSTGVLSGFEVAHGSHRSA